MTDPRLPEERRPGPSRRVRVIGIGSGHPDQLTREAADALAGVAYVIAAAKGEDDPLLDVRRRLCASAGVRLVAVADPERERGRDETSATTAYRGAVRDWHEARVAAYEEVLRAEPGDVAFLVWGDPAFYDSTLRVVDRLRERGAVDFVHDVVPGVSSPQLLAARHRIVLHRVGEPVLVTTGRRLADDVAAGHENLVVMLDGDLACLGLDPAGWRIWWGANLGTGEEQLVAGALGEVGEEIRRRRAAVSQAAGWVMDTYLLRRA
ncbi:MAG: precorrin-6A synthase (deacetylating) [Marmoricola sp.]